MKRVLLSIVGTIAGMSALLGFKTHAVGNTNLSLPAARLPGAGLPGAGTAPATATGAPAGSHPNAGTSRRARGRARGARPGSAAASSGRPARHGSTGRSTASGHHAATGGGAQAPAPGTQQPAPTTQASSTAPAAQSSTPPPPPRTTSAAPPPPPPRTTTSAPPASHNYTGQAVQTRYGTVQVAVTMTGTTITNVKFVQLTSSDSRSQEINQHAGPILLQETLSAQSANIDDVSGATYTSEGYKQSLQSALDQA